MAFNLKDPNRVTFGTGRIIANGEDVGLLQGDVTFNYEPTYKEIKGGSPEQTVKKIMESEAASITANSMELDLNVLGKIVPQFTQSLATGTPVAVVGEYLSGVFDESWQALQNPMVSASETLTVHLAVKLSAPVTAGDTEISVENAANYTAGDTIRLRDGATTETATIDAGGVDTSANTLTVTAGVTNSYTVAGTVANETTTLTAGTDYRVDYLGGRICSINGSDLTDGDSVVVAYTYAPVSGNTLSFGGKTATFTFPMKFISDDADDGKHYEIDFYRAQFDGTLNLSFKPGDVCLVPVSIAALADSSRTAGDQLGRLKLTS